MPSYIPSFSFKNIWSSILAHKIASSIIAVTVAVGGVGIYHSAKIAEAAPIYTLSPARIGSITQTVSGTGQISASNQLDVTSQVSGTIKSINVSVGQHVKTGDLLATIDPTDALQSLRSAQLSLAKLTQPPKTTDLANSQTSVATAYNNGYDAVAGAFLDLPDIMSGMKDLLYGQSGFLSDQHSTSLSTTGQTYRNAAGMAYDAAATQYQKTFLEYQGVTRSSATSTIDTMLADTALTMKKVAEAVTDAQNTVTFVMQAQPQYNPKDAATAAANVNGWSNTSNNDYSSIQNAQNAIRTATNNLTDLTAAPDALDLQSAQDSVNQAEQNYEKYFVRAPFDGIVGRIPVSVYGQAGGSTAIATIVGDQKIATISLNEVDAAKVKTGQRVTITFDAIDGLNATGTVSEVDQVGAVSQGVVSYGVKIAINTADSRIKPGMSVNTSIVTDEEDNVLIVPTAAIKTQGNQSYVQVFNSGRIASTTTGRQGTGAYGGNRSFGSSTRQFASSTAARLSAAQATFSASNAALGRSITISSETPPTRQIVTIGNSDDTNTVILSGLTADQLVVTKTTSASSAGAAAAPSILSNLGGTRGGTGAATGRAGFGGGTGAVRIGGAVGR